MTTTFTDTYNRDDIRRVHASVVADYRIVAEWTGLHHPTFIAQTVTQINALAVEQYLREVHLQLKSAQGVIREAAVYRVSTDASGWSSDRPGDLYWDSYLGDELRVIVFFSDAWRSLAPRDRKAFADIHLSNWETSDFDGDYGVMSSSADRRYASRAYGVQRTRYSR